MGLLQFNGFLWLAWVAYWYIAARFVKATKSSEGWLLRLVHVLPMAAGFYLIFPWGDLPLIGGKLYTNIWFRWFGMALTLAGLLFAVWARIHLGKNWSGIVTIKHDHKLIRTGPYRFVRHPIYTGFLAATLGSAIVAARADAMVGFALIVAACLLKIRREEAVLAREFGDEYRIFQNEVAALVPFIV